MQDDLDSKERNNLLQKAIRLYLSEVCEFSTNTGACYRDALIAHPVNTVYLPFFFSGDILYVVLKLPKLDHRYIYDTRRANLSRSFVV